MPGSVLMTILASASSAPVLPAETTPDASPPATASIATRIDDAAHAQRGGRLHVVADDVGRVPDGAGGARRADGCRSSGVELRLVADQQEARAGVALRGDLQTLERP